MALNSDVSVKRIKRPTRPIIREEDRSALLAALACVTHVLIFDEDTPESMLRRIRPDVLVKGGTTTDIVGREIVEAYGGRVYLASQLQGVSTTQLINIATGCFLTIKARWQSETCPLQKWPRNDSQQAPQTRSE